MKANLVLLAKNGKQKAFPLPSNVTVIGRRHNCDLRIPLESVSRRHCQLSYENDQVTVRDLGSRNGTLLNGTKIEQGKVKAGDFLQIGEALFALQINGIPQQISPPAPSPSEPDGEDTMVSGADSDALDGALDDLGELDDMADLDDEIDLDAL